MSMNPVWTMVVGWVFASSLAGFILMGIDKARARQGGWRVPEMTFFTLSLVGGAFGVLAGSGVFHHKTLKGTFVGVVLALAMLWLAILLELTRLLGSPSSRANPGLSMAWALLGGLSFSSLRL
jgi:uncharacterized membrane protein YsdA (DUF1294 family)